jgi:hypothetical protein
MREVGHSGVCPTFYFAKERSLRVFRPEMNLLTFVVIFLTDHRKKISFIRLKSISEQQNFRAVK